MVGNHRQDDFAAPPAALPADAELHRLQATDAERGQHMVWRVFIGHSARLPSAQAGKASLTSCVVSTAPSAREMRPHIEELAPIAPVYLSCYPNAGLPNALGEYDQTPDEMAELLHEYAGNNWINIVGGCCGTTPDYIRAIADAVKTFPPRVPPRSSSICGSAAWKPLTVHAAKSNFIMVGERTNVTGSPKFAQLVKAGDLEPALAIAKQQIDGGANILDVNMDEGLLDSEKVMTRVPPPRRLGARHRPRPDHDRLVEVDGARSGTQMHAGQVGRQLDLAQRRRRRSSASRPGSSAATAPP